MARAVKSSPLRQWCKTCQKVTITWRDVDGTEHCGGCEKKPRRVIKKEKELDG